MVDKSDQYSKSGLHFMEKLLDGKNQQVKNITKFNADVKIGCRKIGFSFDVETK